MDKGICRVRNIFALKAKSQVFFCKTSVVLKFNWNSSSFIYCIHEFTPHKCYKSLETILQHFRKDEEIDMERCVVLDIRIENTRTNALYKLHDILKKKKENFLYKWICRLCHERRKFKNVICFFHYLFDRNCIKKIMNGKNWKIYLNLKKK